MQPFDLELGGPIDVSLTQAAKVYYQVTIWPNRSVLGNLSLLYSLLPIFVYPWLLLLWALYAGSAYPAMALLFALGLCLGNEIFIKPWIREPRPAMCPIKNSYGMPSGHSLFAGFLLAFLWNFRTSLLARLVLLTALAPVPWARWHNRDHTDKQVVVGWMGGFVSGLLLGLVFGRWSVLC